MSNGKPTPKTIDAYLAQFEAEWLESKEDIQESVEQRGKQQEAPQIELSQSEASAILASEITSMIDEAPRFDANPELSVEPELMENQLQSNERNWWNTLYQQIDQIQTSKFKGKKLFAETAIRDIDKELEELDIKLKTDPALSPEEMDSINSRIKALSTQREDLQENIAGYIEDIEHNLAQIENEPISDFYKQRTQQEQETEPEGAALPNLWEYLTSQELAQDIGGSWSESSAMVAATFGPTLLSHGAAAVTAAGPANAVPGVAIGAFALGLIGSGILMHVQRDAESSAEAWDAYEDRVARDVARFKMMNERDPSDFEMEQIKEVAAKGSKKAYDQNMNLYMGDVAQIGVGLFAPWNKLLISALGVTGATKVLGYGSSMAFQSFMEGREEGDQFLIKSDYLQGKYDPGTKAFDESYLQSLSRSVDLGLETSRAMLGMMTGNHVPGRSENPEFRSSVRAGSFLGLFMGGTTQFSANLLDRSLGTLRNRYSDAGQRQVLEGYAKDLQSHYNSSTIYDMLDNTDKAKNVREYINKIPDEVFIGDKTKEGALKEFDLIASMYNRLQGPEFKNLNKIEKKAVIATMLRSKEYALNATNLAVLNEEKLTEAYNNVYGAVKRADGFNEVNKIKHKLAGLKQQKAAIKKELKSKKTAVNGSKLGRDRVLADALEQFEVKEKELKTQLKEVQETYPEFKEKININKDIRNLEGITLQAQLEAERHNNYYLQMEKMNGEQIKEFAPYAEYMDVVRDSKSKEDKLKKEKEKQKNMVKDPNQVFEKGDLVDYKKNTAEFLELNPDGTYKIKLKKDNSIINVNPDDTHKITTFEGALDRFTDIKNNLKNSEIEEEGNEISETFLQSLSLGKIINSEVDLSDPLHPKTGPKTVIINSNKEAKKKGENPTTLENITDDKVDNNEIYGKPEESRIRFAYLRKGKSGILAPIVDREKIINFLEQNKESDIVKNYKVEYRINTNYIDSSGFLDDIIYLLSKKVKGRVSKEEKAKNKPRAEKIISLFKNPQFINKGTAKTLGVKQSVLEEIFNKAIIEFPVDVYIVNKKTNDVATVLNKRGKEVEVDPGFLYAGMTKVKETRDNLIEHKLKIYNLLARDRTPIGDIEAIYGGKIENTPKEIQNDPREVFGDTMGRLGIGNYIVGGVAIDKKGTILSDYFKFDPDRHNGVVFLEILRGDGTTTAAAKVNTKNLTAEEAGIILDIYSKRILNPNKGLTAPYENSGLTYGQMINLLVYEGSNATTRDDDRVLSVDVKTKTIRFGKTGVIKGTEINDIERKQFIDHVTKHKKRRVNLEQINNSIFSGELAAIEEFEFLGTKIKKGENDNYNDILMDQGVLTVNVPIRENQNPFDKPSIILSQELGTETKSIPEVPGAIKEVKKQKGKPNTGQQDFGSFSEVTPESLIGPRINEEKAKAYWAKNAPDFPVEFVDDYIKMGNRLGSLAQGMFQATGVKLSKKGARGAEKHELYHVIEELMLTNEERAQLNDETREITGPVSDNLIQKHRVQTPVTLNQAKELGFDTRREFYEHKALSERRAIANERYTESDGEYKFAPKANNFFKKIWNWIKNIFSKPKVTVDGLFEQIHKGYYKGQNPRPERIKALIDAGFVSYSEVATTIFKGSEIKHITSTLLFNLVQRAGGIRKFVEDDKIVLDIEEAFKGLEEYIGEIEEGVLKSYNERILEHKEFFREELKNKLRFLNAEEVLIEDEDVQAVEEEGDMSIFLATRPTYEISNRGKIRPIFRLLAAMTPKLNSTKKTKDGYDITKNINTGLAELEDDKLFSVIEDGLANIMDGYYPKYNEKGEEIAGEYEYKYASDIMLENLKDLVRINSSIQYIVDAVESIPGLKSKLHASFNNRSISFINQNFRGPSGHIDFRTVDVSSVRKRDAVITEWFENFKDKDFISIEEDKIVGKKDILNDIIKSWTKIFSKAPRLLNRFDAAKEVFTDDIASDIIEHLDKVGITIDKSELKETMELTAGNRTKYRQKFQKLIAEINKIFVAVGKDSFSLKEMAKGKEIDYDTNNVIKSESIIKNLALAKAKFANNLGESTVTSTEGRSHWIYGAYNYMNQVIQMIKNSTHHINQLRKSPFNKNSVLLDYLSEKSGRDSVEVKTYGALRGQNQSGMLFKNLKHTDEHAARIALQVKNKMMLPLTFASKSVWQFLKGIPKFVTVESSSFKWDNDGLTIPNGIKNIFSFQILDEYNRISQVEKHLEGGLDPDQMIVNMHYSIDEQSGKRNYEDAQGLTFRNFPEIINNPELRKLFFNSEGKTFDHIDQDIIKKLYPYVGQILEKRLKGALNKALETGVITRNEETGVLENNALDSKQITRYTNKYEESVDAAIRRMIADYTLNGIFNNLEMQKLLLGDSAFYTKIDKKPPSLIATGAGLAKIVNEQGHEKTHYTVGFALDKFKLSDIHPQLAEIMTTDGNALISPQHHKDLVTGLEGWNPDKEDAWQRLKKGTAKVADIDILITQPLKGMHFELRHHADMSVPTYLKYSIVPLYKTFTEGTQLDNIRRAMENEEKPIDVIAFMSAVKSGAQSPINLLDEDGNIKNDRQINEEITPARLQLRHWKLQQTSPVKSKDNEAIATQIRKVAQGGLEVLNPNKPRHKEIAKELHEIEIASSNKQTTRFKNEYGIELENQGSIDNDYVINNMVKLFNDVKETITRSTSISRHLRSDFDVADNKLVNDPAVSPLRRKGLQIIGSMITKAATKIKGAGGGHILISGGFFTNITKTSQLNQEEKKEILESSFVNLGDLKPTYIDKETGKVVKGHIWITMPESWRKAIPNAGKLSSKELKKYLRSEEMRSAIGYRIPTQWLSSIDGHEIAGILPATYGNAIIAYDELIPKTGHDFDFDKWYVLLPELDYNKEQDRLYYVKYDKSIPASEQSMKALWNRRIELYLELLSDPDVHKRSMTPLETINSKRDAAIIRYQKNKDKFLKGDHVKLITLRKAGKHEEYIDFIHNKLDQMEDLQWVSPDHQMNLKRWFAVGQFGLGQMARHSSDHGMSSYNSENEVFGIEDLRIGHEDPEGRGFTDLRQMFNTKGELIYGILSSYLNANVDIEGDITTVEWLNMVPATNNHRALLTRAGAVSEQWVNFLLSQDIIVDLTNTMDNSEGSLSIKEYDKQGLIKAEDDVIKKWAKRGGFLIDKDTGEILTKNGTVVKSLNPRKIGIKELENMFNGPESQDNYYKRQLQILQYFREITPQTKSLNRSVDAHQADVKGTGGSIAASQNMLDLVDLVKNDELLVGIEGRFKDTSIGAYIENGPKLFIDAMREIYPETGDAFQQAIRLLRANANRDLFSNELTDLITDHLYASLYMRADGTTKTELKELFYGENAAANKLWDLKYGPNKIKDSDLIDFLVPVKSRGENDLGYIKANFGSIKNPDHADDIVLDWQELAEKEGWIGEFFSKLLPKYALYSSGWRTNLFSFHELVPPNLREHITTGFRKFKNPNVSNLEELGLNDGPFFHDLMPQIYKHMWWEKTLVPNARNTDVKITNKVDRVEGKKKGTVIRFKTDHTKFRVDKIEDISVYKPFLTLQDKVTGQENLYEYVGNDEKNTDIAIYEITNKLGLRDENNRYVYEYSFENQDTFIEENKVDHITQVVEEVKSVDVEQEAITKKTDNSRIEDQQENIRTFEGEKDEDYKAKPDCP